MARDRRDDGARRRDAPRNGNGGGGRVLSFISGLLIGLTVAVLVYFSMLDKTRPAEEPAATRHGVPARQTPAAAKSVPEEEPAPVEEADTPPTPPAPPKPAFDFYKILPDSEVKVPDEELARPAAPATTTAPEKPVAYMLQVGSYQKFEEADQKKAQLALQGITSRIERSLTNGHEVWYRVQVGPLKTPQDAQAMKGRLVEGGSNVVVLKVDASR